MGVKVNKGTWTDPGTGKSEPERDVTYGGDAGYAEDNVEPERDVSHHPLEDDMPPVKKSEPIRIETTTAETPPPKKVDEEGDETDESRRKAKKAPANKAKTAPPENK